MSQFMPVDFGPQKDEGYPRFEFEVRAVTENDFAPQGKTRVLRFTRLFGPKQSITNAEYLTADELEKVTAGILGYYSHRVLRVTP